MKLMLAQQLIASIQEQNPEASNQNNQIGQ
jgi:hypothetical protein